MANPSSDNNPLQLKYRMNPPVGLSTDNFIEVATLVTLDQVSEGISALQSNLNVIHVGSPPVSKSHDMPKQFSQMATFKEDNVHVSVMNSFERSDASALEDAFNQSIGDAQKTNKPRVLLIVHTLGVDLLPVVSGGVSKVVQAGLVLDVIASSTDIDFRAWERIAHDGRGRLFVPREEQSVGMLLGHYLESLNEEKFADLRLTVRPCENLRYLRAFWAGDEPAFLLDREPAEMRNVVNLNVPLGLPKGNRAAAWLLVAIVPRRKTGTYRLFELELSATTTQGPVTQKLDVCHRVSTQPNDARIVDGYVGAAYARVKPTFWVEELGQALSHEDGGRILNLYDPFINWAREDGHKLLVDTLWSAKRAFQRGGYFGTRQLNEFWRMAHHGLAEER